ncbi:hypothetical protein EBZ80_26755 [bacterium]|nr:hypothetical protein [bacterium]
MPYNPNPPNYTDPRFREYRNKLVALGAINTDDKAKQYQRLFEEFHGVVLTIQDHETSVLPTS